MTKKWRVASAKLEKPIYDKYNAFCLEKKGCSIHKSLKDFIESELSEDKKPIEVGESKNVESRGKIEINNGSNNESISKSDGELQTANPTGTDEFFFI